MARFLLYIFRVVHKGSPQDFIKVLGSSHSEVFLDILIISYWKAVAFPLQPPSVLENVDFRYKYITLHPAYFIADIS